MNKKMILPFVAILMLAVAMVGAASADDVTTVDMVEVRGTIEELNTATPSLNDTGGDREWDYSEFAGFWYDLDDNLETETLTILATETEAPFGDTLNYSTNERTIGEGSLIYKTHAEFQEYELHENELDDTDRGQNAMEVTYNLSLTRIGETGLCVESDAGKVGDCGYFLEGWMAEQYVAIDNNADKLCKLLVEFEDDDKKTLATGEEWDLGGGFSLTANQIDLEGNKVWFSLAKDGKEIDDEVTSTGAGATRQDRVYTYTADIGNEENIPVFSCYVDAVFRGTDSNIVQVMYVFLIDDDVLEIDTSDTYGAMEVMTASKTQVVLKNDETTIDLDEDTTEHIMGNMYFKTADDDQAIRFYPMVEYTEPGTYEVRGTIEELDGTPNTLTINTPAGTPADEQGRVWDYSEFAGFWYDLDDNLETETLTILATEPEAPFGDTLKYSTNERTIGEGSLIYKTHAEFQEYELHENELDDTDRGQNAMEVTYNLSLTRIGETGLCVESDAGKVGDCGYFLEGWMAEQYVAIDNNADKLCKLLVEFEDDDKKTLATGEEWDLGGGFSLTANQIDLEGNKVWFSLAKDGKEIDDEVTSTGAGATRQDRVYTYTADIGNEENIPVFSCYVDAVFRGTDSNIVQVMYVFLIDDDVLEIDTSDTYGAMEVMTASKTQVVLKNDETTIDLDEDTTEHIMGNMYFKTADDDQAIRFYPMVEYTIGEGAPGEAEEEVETPTEVNETVEANVTATAVVTPTLEPTATVEDTVTDAEDTTTDAEPAATEKKTPGFEAIFAIAGLLAVAYLVLRQRE